MNFIAFQLNELESLLTWLSKLSTTWSLLTRAGMGDWEDMKGGVVCGTSMWKENRSKKTLLLVSPTPSSRSFIKFWLSEEYVIPAKTPSRNGGGGRT